MDSSAVPPGTSTSHAVADKEAERQAVASGAIPKKKRRTPVKDLKHARRGEIGGKCNNFFMFMFLCHINLQDRV